MKMLYNIHAFKYKVFHVTPNCAAFTAFQHSRANFSHKKKSKNFKDVYLLFRETYFTFFRGHLPEMDHVPLVP